MPPAVRRRRRKRHAWVDNIVAADSWSAAFVTAHEATRDNGAKVYIHRESCPTQHGGACECAVIQVGPSVRGVWQ